MNKKQRERAHYWRIEGREAFRAGIAYEDFPYKPSLYGASYFWQVGWLLEKDVKMREDRTKQEHEAEYLGNKEAPE